MRRKKIVRDTKETKIVLALEIDGSGAYEINTGCGFLDHMLELFTRHGRFDIAVDCNGDTHVDYHHTVEDIGIAMGRAFREALGDKRGIYRYGSMLLPMPGPLLYVCTIPTAAAKCSTATAPDTFIFWTEKQERFLTATRSVRESSKHLLLSIKVIWSWEPATAKYGEWNCSNAVSPPFFKQALEHV